MDEKLIIMMITLAPVEALVEMLEDELKKYKLDSNDDNLRSLIAAAAMLAVKSKSIGESNNPEKQMKTVLKMMEDFEEHSKIQKIMKGGS